MESTRKRPLNNPSQSSDAKKSKPIDEKDVSSSATEEALTIKSARGNRLVLPKRRVKAKASKEQDESQAKTKDILKDTAQEVKEGKLTEKECKASQQLVLIGHT